MALEGDVDGCRLSGEVRRAGGQPGGRRTQGKCDSHGQQAAAHEQYLDDVLGEDDRRFG
jgi:hypothetical protein